MRSPMLAPPSPEQWADYIEQALVDQLRPEFKRIIWEMGFQPVLVRQMLARQRREERERLRACSARVDQRQLPGS